MTATTETWLDIVPTIPEGWEGHVVWQLPEYALPVLGPDPEDPRRVRVGDPQRGGELSQFRELLRPALNDPRGFGYALRTLVSAAAERDVLLNTLLDRERCLMELLARWVQGTTTDADRFALAHALRHVYEG